jgi:hypothetical protein
MTNTKTVKSRSAREAEQKAAFVPTDNGCPLIDLQRYKGASLNASCAGRFGSTEIAQVPGVGYEDIVSDKKSSLGQEARVNRLGEPRYVRYNVERCVPAQLSSS